jgi:hypothetical protein
LNAARIVFKSKGNAWASEVILTRLSPVPSINPGLGFKLTDFRLYDITKI